MSLPVRGAWIEIVISATCVPRALSLPVRGAWIEMILSRFRVALARRRSPCGERGLKSSLSLANTATSLVAPRAGSVD